MNGINLLPPAIEASKKARRLNISLIILQAAILLCMGAAFVLLRYYKQSLQSQSSHLTESIASFDEEPLLIVSQLEEARALTLYFDDFLLENFPVTFETFWVSAILENLPEDASVLTLRYQPPEIALYGEVAHIQDANLYKQALADLALFGDVSLGRVSLLESGMFSYEMTIWVTRDE